MRRIAGFSLIESAVTVGIIISAVFILGIFISVIGLRTGTEHMARASRIVTDAMEDLRAIDVASLPASGAVTHPELDSLPSGAGSYTVTDFEGDVTVKEITVTVTWSAKGTDRAVTRSTLRTAEGL